MTMVARLLPHARRSEFGLECFKKSNGRLRSIASSSGDEADAGAWRKQQLNNLERKFSEPRIVENEEDLQSMWKQMESRVTNRRPRTLRETGGRTGRSNLKTTDEDVWLKEGLYDDDKDTNA